METFIAWLRAHKSLIKRPGLLELTCFRKRRLTVVIDLCNEKKKSNTFFFFPWSYKLSMCRLVLDEERSTGDHSPKWRRGRYTDFPLLLDQDLYLSLEFRAQTVLIRVPGSLWMWFISTGLVVYHLSRFGCGASQLLGSPYCCSSPYCPNGLAR